MNPVSRFALHVVLLLPICFAAWYYFSILFVTPLAPSLDAVLAELIPQTVTDVAQEGNTLRILVSILPGSVENQRWAGKAIKLSAHPLDYSYGIALFTSLVLASSKAPRNRPLKWIIGCAALLVVSLVGVTTQVMTVIAFEVMPKFGLEFDWTYFGYNSLAFSHKLSYLVLAPLAPVALWFALFPDQIRVLR